MSVQVDRGSWLCAGPTAPVASVGDASAARRQHARSMRRGELVPAARGAEEAGGIYFYGTKAGTRWYFKLRGSDGVQTSRRGFTSARAARDARRRLTERIERGEAARPR